MAKFKITYVETAEYTFEVDADSYDAADGLAHDILLGGGEYDGALVIKQPDGIRIQCEIPECDWYIEEAE